MAVYPLISIRTRSITPSNFYNLFFIYFTVYLITNQNILRAGIKKKIHGTVCSMKERTTITLSLRSAFFCSNSSIAFALRASRALSSCSLKGQSLGIPGSFSTFFFPLNRSFFASFVFFLLCSLTFLMTLYFFFSETLLLLLSSTQQFRHKKIIFKLKKTLILYNDGGEGFEKEFSYSCSSSPSCRLEKGKERENGERRRREEECLLLRF